MPIFSVSLRWFPVSGMYAIYGGGGLTDLAHHLVLPAVTLAVVATGGIARLTRSTMLEVLRQDFVRTARAKGLTERTVILRHALRNALVNIVPIIGLRPASCSAGSSISKPSSSGPASAECWSPRSQPATSCWSRGGSGGRRLLRPDQSGWRT